MRIAHPTLLVIVLLIAGLAATDGLAADSKIAALRVYPQQVRLTTARDYQSFVVQAVQTDGITRDVTSAAKFTPANPGLVTLNGAVLKPKADGKTTLSVEYGGKKVVIPVTVEKAAADRPISFKLDVMPVFMKSGCNMGSCHGAARGKDGFRLSLFGFDPDGDYHRLTREISGRRINIAIPADSLMLTKASGSVPHTGGKQFAVDSEYYKTLRRWIAAGAPDDEAEVAEVVGLEMSTDGLVFEKSGAENSLKVTALVSDGTRRDGTRLARFH
ncbi:MAG: cell surface protein, partial [Planctomycetes bacterium]|nr:cell surface protein [Planctomycetota bacterium]